MGLGLLCCARKLSGHAVADPTIALTKSRRRIASPKRLKECVDYRLRHAITAGICDGRNGVGPFILRGNNPWDRMSALGHSRPSHFVPVLNNVRYASDSDHSRYESELTLWAISRHQSTHSMTSSARARSVAGTFRRSAFAVLRLITISNLVGRMTGRSAGFSPLRMRPV
jgi:hypothetical protein